MSLEHVLKNSAVADKRPTAAQLANGEISLNWNAAGPFLCCKDTAGNVQEIGGVRISETEPVTPVRGTTWLKPSTHTLYIHTGAAWESVAGGGGGGTPAPPGGGLSNVVGTAPIKVTGTGATRTIAIDDALTTGKGAVQLATDAETAYDAAAPSATKVVTPSGLHAHYMPKDISKLTLLP